MAIITMVMDALQLAKLKMAINVHMVPLLSQVHVPLSKPRSNKYQLPRITIS